RRRPSGPFLVDDARLRRHHPRLAREDLLAVLVDTHGLESDAIALAEHLEHVHPGGDRLSGPYGLHELEALREVGGAGPRGPRTDDRRAQPRGADAGRGRPLARRRRGVLAVALDRIHVTRRGDDARVLVLLD